MMNGEESMIQIFLKITFEIEKSQSKKIMLKLKIMNGMFFLI